MTGARAWDALPSPLRAALASGTTVVTPNKRLARRLAAIHDDAQRAAGRAVWSAAVVMPWNGWLERLWLDVLASDNPVAPPRLFPSAHGAYLWKRIVASEGLSLIDEHGASALAAEAWSLVHAWGAGGPSWRAWAGGDDDRAAFARWADEFAGNLTAGGALDPAQLPDWLVRGASAARIWRGASVTLAGFVELAPQQRRLLAALAAAGMEVGHCATVRDSAGSLRRAVGGTPRDEIAGALRWARERALADPGATIGIAIEDFAARRDEVRALAEDILCPSLQWPGREDAVRPYNLSLGDAVSEVPILSAALALIGLVHAPLPMARAAALLRSPYVAGAPDDWLCRGQLEADWLRDGRRDISLEDAIGALSAVDRALADRWRAARAGLRRPANGTPREWTEFWRTWLATAGWPGDRALSSAEWQARGAWDALLAQFATLGAVTRRIPAREAVAALVALANEHVFQPESPRAPIEILGLLEATGLPLDALWVTGLAAEVWPPAPRPNPLLALSWQREHDVPRSTAARELAYAQALAEQWSRGASEVVFSYAERADDHARSLSWLVPIAPSLGAPSAPAPPTASVQFASGPPWEQIGDDRAPPLADGAEARGGAALIEAQSDCPFRAAARFRLGAEAWPEPVEGLSAIERGILVHAAFAAFWRDIGDHATLVALAPDALAARVEAAAAAALDAIPSPRWRRLAPVVRAGEAARVASLVRRWVDGLERSRPPFAVAEMEAPRRLALGGLDLRLRLDRIDALADGGVAIIDYKTGLAKPPARWFDARPQGPQIGLYVLAERAFAPAVPVRGAAYAQLKPGELRVQGIAAEAESWPGLAAPEGVRGANLRDWSDAEAHWARSLGALATEVREGHAAVTPRDAPATCRHCGLQPLCRIGALAKDETAERDDA